MENNTHDVKLDPKVIAARKAIQALATPLDLDLWADAHPNEEKALNRLLDALDAIPAENE